MPSFLETAKPKFAKAIDHLKHELNGLRSGRATPSLVEHVKVEAYDTITPLIELASITAPEPRLLIVAPWDKTIVKEVAKALELANLGVNPVVDGALVRLNFPPLTEERRKELTKLVAGKLEEARVTVRNVREETLKQLKDEKTKGKIGEDEFFAVQKDMQQEVDKQNEKIKEMGETKSREIMTI